MAEAADKVPENKKGKFYVDQQCIDCDLCRDVAPRNFTRDNTNGYSYVYKQPENAAEEAECEDALSMCPVDAIGENG